MIDDTDRSETIVLRISGLGHDVTLTDLFLDQTVLELKSEIARCTSVPVNYQKLITRGVKFDSVVDDAQTTLQQIGLKDRTKIMLLHNGCYAREKDVFEQLNTIESEINELESKINSAELVEKTVVSELVTKICCKLDDVDVKGSDNLRTFRKTLIRKAENLDSASA